MTVRVELPGDSWADVRLVEDITEREWRPMRRQLGKIVEYQGSDDADTDVAVDNLERFGDEFLLMFVTEWSFGPVDMDTLLGIPTAVYATLMKKTPELGELMPNFDVSPEEGSPTSPSDA